MRGATHRNVRHRQARSPRAQPGGLGRGAAGDAPPAAPHQQKQRQQLWIAAIVWQRRSMGQLGLWQRLAAPRQQEQRLRHACRDSRQRLQTIRTWLLQSSATELLHAFTSCAGSRVCHHLRPMGQQGTVSMRGRGRLEGIKFTDGSTLERLCPLMSPSAAGPCHRSMHTPCSTRHCCCWRSVTRTWRSVRVAWSVTCSSCTLQQARWAARHCGKQSQVESGIGRALAQHLLLRVPPFCVAGGARGRAAGRETDAQPGETAGAMSALVAQHKVF